MLPYTCGYSVQIGREYIRFSAANKSDERALFLPFPWHAVSKVETMRTSNVCPRCFYVSNVYGFIHSFTLTRLHSPLHALYHNCPRQIPFRLRYVTQSVEAETASPQNSQNCARWQQTRHSHIAADGWQKRDVCAPSHAFFFILVNFIQLFWQRCENVQTTFQNAFNASNALRCK